MQFKVFIGTALSPFVIACISHHLQLYTVAVYNFQKVVLEYLKLKLPMLKKMIYFNDGCGGQYKNYKNFMNLMKHRDEFALNAEWNSFCHIAWKECF